MRPLIILFASLLLAGCSTPHFAASEGKTLTHVYAASWTNTWRATLVACQRPPLSIEQSDPATGTVSARSPMRWESWGERVRVTLRSATNGTEVAVWGKMVGPSFDHQLNWSYDILKTIAVTLGEPIPPPPPAPPIERARSPKG